MIIYSSSRGRPRKSTMNYPSLLGTDSCTWQIEITLKSELYIFLFQSSFSRLWFYQILSNSPNWKLKLIEGFTFRRLLDMDFDVGKFRLLPDICKLRMQVISANFWIIYRKKIQSRMKTLVYFSTEKTLRGKTHWGRGSAIWCSKNGWDLGSPAIFRGAITPWMNQKCSLYTLGLKTETAIQF